MRRWLRSRCDDIEADGTRAVPALRASTAHSPSMGNVSPPACMAIVIHRYSKCLAASPVRYRIIPWSAVGVVLVLQFTHRDMHTEEIRPRIQDQGEHGIGTPGKPVYCWYRQGCRKRCAVHGVDRGRRGYRGCGRREETVIESMVLSSMTARNAAARSASRRRIMARRVE